MIMICPIQLRTNWFQPNAIPVASVRLEHNWLICRQIIVFAGNILSLIYGLMIVVVLNWLDTESAKQLPHLAKHPLDSDYWTAYYIIAFSLIGSISMIIKSNFGACLDALFMDLDDRNQDNENQRDIQIINTEHNSQTLLDEMIDHLKMKLTLLKNCLRYGPVLTFNVLLALMIIPYELSIAKSGVTYCLENCSQHWITAQQKKNYVLLMDLCLTVLVVSVILIQLCVIVYNCDLIKTSIDKKSFVSRFRRILHRMNTNAVYASSRGNKDESRMRNAVAQRHKNIMFHHFLAQNQNSIQTKAKQLEGKVEGKEELVERPHSYSRSSTITASEAAHCSTSFSHSPTDAGADRAVYV
ncbi:unnamed protein product [Oppiella nova]|uniref:Uncharacterized protein n=1 Tax=Oppiella nova TaxID=334625 RepID=A0A7R9M3Y0_9ACAR|nr:unnamed protein product [Oppiella nova]CAG2170312.1 unnamed protein product [Oppiella nova]